MAMVCGIDEAGRGPVIGPLVIAGVLIEDKDEPKLKAIKVKDSKLLTKKRREELFKKIIKIVKNYTIITIHPKEVDLALQTDHMNLNWLEAHKSADIINFLNPDEAIIDSPSNNIKAYTAYIKKLLKSKKTKLRLEHKAERYPVVAAASILAKVTRDNEIEKIQKTVKEKIGSGYCADPITKEFLKKNYKKYPELFRKEWAPYKDVVQDEGQKRLGDF